MTLSRRPALRPRLNVCAAAVPWSDRSLSWQAQQVIDLEGLRLRIGRLRTKGSGVRISPGAPITTCFLNSLRLSARSFASLAARRSIGTAVSLATAALCTGACSNRSAELSRARLEGYASEFVPQDATGRKTEPGIPWVQLSFTVRRAPLEFPIDANRLLQATADGWTLCQPMPSEWTSYLDMSVTPARYRQTRTYVLYREGVLLLLVGMYDGDSEATAVKRGGNRMEMPVQHVAVVARPSSAPESREVAARQNLTCGKRAESARP